MPEWKFWTVMIGAILAIVALSIALNAVSTDSGRRTECVRIGTNPCVPIVHPSK
jgi:hypothetical protein